jgi:outer membrane lipoprotein-sorting protein
MSPKRKALPAVALAALLVLSGCAGFAGQLDDDQQQQVADRLADRLEELDGFEATMTTEIETSDRSVTSKADVAVDLRTGEYRTETLKPEQNAGDVMVYNGSSMVSYDASENVYHTFDVEMDGPAMGSNLSAQFDQLVEETDIIYNGTETVNGQETHKATLVPTNESDQFVDAVTLWVETDRMVPVKMEMEASGMANLTTTVTFSDVELNPEFQANTFEFEAPADATYEDNVVETETERYEDRAELASAVDLDVPPAELPDGFSFQDATVFEDEDGEPRSVMVDYSDGEREVTVSLSEAQGGMQAEVDGEEDVTVDGHDATYRPVGESTGNVVWSCNGTEYIVFGNLDKSTLLSVADGIGC